MDHSKKMLITSVEKQTNNKYYYHIYLDGKKAFTIHEDLLVKHRLLKGEYVFLDQLEHLTNENTQHQAFLQAVRYVGRRPRSRIEVMRLLKQKGYEQSIIETVIEKLLSHNIIDDQQFAHTWAEQRLFSQGKGKRWIQKELIHKGLSRDHINAALDRVDEETEFKCAFDQAIKKWGQLKGEKKIKTQKLISFMLQRGYSSSIISLVLKKLTGTDDSDFAKA